MLQGILFLFLALYDAVSDVLESSVHRSLACIEVAEITQTLKIVDFTM